MIIPTVYGGSTARAWTAAAPILTPLSPSIIMLHAALPGSDPRAPTTTSFADQTILSTVAMMRAALPSMILWMGIGVDTIARRVLARTWSVNDGIAAFVALARGARSVGAVRVVWDGEAAYKAAPGSADAQTLALLVSGAVAAVARDVPGIEQGHTAYDSVGAVDGWGGHGTYCWNAWIGPASPVDLTLPQCYPAISAPVGPGVLAHRWALSVRSYDAAVRAGVVGSHVVRMPYLGLHGVPPADTVALANATGAALWAIPNAMDAQGIEAVQSLLSGNGGGVVTSMLTGGAIVGAIIAAWRWIRSRAGG